MPHREVKWIESLFEDIIPDNFPNLMKIISHRLKNMLAYQSMLLNRGLEKTLESPLDCKEIQPVHPKGNLSGIFIGRTDAEAKTPILRPPDAKNWFIGKDPDGRKDWRQAEKGMTEDEMVGWHHRLSGHEFEKTLGLGDRQGGLACCSPWGRKESGLTEWLNWRALKCIWLSLVLSWKQDRNWGNCPWSGLPWWHFLVQGMKVKSESEVAQSCLTQQPHGLKPTRLLHPWDFPGKSTGVGCHCLLQPVLLMNSKSFSPL